MSKLSVVLPAYNEELMVEMCIRDRVYSAIDPDMFIIECLDPKYNCVRDGQDGLPCLVHRELLSVQDELISLLKRKTIQQIMEEA